MGSKPGKDGHIYFMGIGGTGMAAVAGLCQEAGYRVSGSDAGVYPPMSNMLAELGIPVSCPYSPDNLRGQHPDLVVIANVLSRGNPELEYALDQQLPLRSFPQLLGELFLNDRKSCVVAGTHGKTTTSTLLAHMLEQLGHQAGFMIGGSPRNFSRSFRVGTGACFVIEGDEYDTAYFDKGPKFLHYRPQYLIVNNIEFDHADIYKNVEEIEAQFEKLIALVPVRRNIIANVDDPGVARVLARMGLADQVTRVATLGHTQDAHVIVGKTAGRGISAGEQEWTADITSGHYGKISYKTTLSGRHNIANLAMVIACLEALGHDGVLQLPADPSAVVNACRSFLSPKRRMDLLASRRDIDVYEDFAHHPTAVRLVIEGFRQAWPAKRLIVAFEPRSATQRRNVFQDMYAETLSLADRVFIGECPDDKRIAPEGKFSPLKLKENIGEKATTFPTNPQLLEALMAEVRPGDAVIFMSSGSFSGIQHLMASRLQGQETGP